MGEGPIHCGVADRWSNQTCGQPAKHEGPCGCCGLPVEPVAPEKQIDALGVDL